MASSGNLDEFPVSTVEESVLRTLRRLCPSAVTNYENLLKVLTSESNKLNLVDSALVAGKVFAVFSMLINLARENQLVRAAQLENSKASTSPGLTQT